MRAASIATAVFSLLLLAACGKQEAKKEAAPPATPPAGTATPTPEPPPVPGVVSWVGTVEKMGPSITMQGTHRLVNEGKTVVLLKSAKADLAAWEGKRARVTGAATRTVEGDATIVDVETIREER